jgi:L-aminopeptidase/D-esterase-like protein
MHPTITKVRGIEVGHWTDLEAATGCTVIVCRQGAVGGVDVRGSAPVRVRQTFCALSTLCKKHTP